MVRYDYLIVAVGAQTNFFSFIKGLKEHTHGVKNIQRAFEFRQAFEERLSSKLQNRQFKRAGDMHIAIAGAGIRGADMLGMIDTPKNKMEQIITNEMLCVQNYENVFAIGDCAQMKDAHGTILPPTAQMAEKSAAYVAKSIMHREQKMPIEPFHAAMDGLFVALGGKYAVGVLYKKIKVKGYLAYLLKKIITRFYRLGLEVKVNTGYKKRNTES